MLALHFLGLITKSRYYPLQGISAHHFAILKNIPRISSILYGALPRMSLRAIQPSRVQF